MQELKCKRCGGDLETWNVADEGLYGRCTHCRTSYLIDDVDRSHMIVDVRVPPGLTLPGDAKLTRRGLIGGGVAVVGLTLAGAGILAPILMSGERERSGAKSTIRPLWNIGGKGPGPGQFRDYLTAVTIDGQGRSAITVSSSPQVQLFDGDGRFLARWVFEYEYGRLRVALPGGDLIVSGKDGLERRDPMTGRVLATIPNPDDLSMTAADQYAATPDGGFALYFYSTAKRHVDGVERTEADDRLHYFGADGAPIRSVGPLIGKIFRPDPAQPAWPKPAALAIDGGGTVYLLFYGEEFDTRAGLYAFSPDGALLRKIEVERKYSGMLAATADGAVYHADPWTTVITRVKGAETSTIDIADLRGDAGEGVGMPFEIAAFPNGDLGLATGSHRYLRLRWPTAE